MGEGLVRLRPVGCPQTDQIGTLVPGLVVWVAARMVWGDGGLLEAQGSEGFRRVVGMGMMIESAILVPQDGEAVKGAWALLSPPATKQDLGSGRHWNTLSRRGDCKAGVQLCGENHPSITSTGDHGERRGGG